MHINKTRRILVFAITTISKLLALLSTTLSIGQLSLSIKDDGLLKAACALPVISGILYIAIVCFKFCSRQCGCAFLHAEFVFQAAGGLCAVVLGAVGLGVLDQSSHVQQQTQQLAELADAGTVAALGAAASLAYDVMCWVFDTLGTLATLMSNGDCGAFWKAHVCACLVQHDFFEAAEDEPAPAPPVAKATVTPTTTEPVAVWITAESQDVGSGRGVGAKSGSWVASATDGDGAYGVGDHNIAGDAGEDNGGSDNGEGAAGGASETDQQPSFFDGKRVRRPETTI